MSSIQALTTLYERDIDRLKNEIASYQQETNLWRKEGTIANSAGNLCLHLIGNLKHFIGLHIGQVPYERDRDGEFSNTDIPRDDMIAEIEGTKAIVSKALNTLSDHDLNKDYPIEFGGNTPTIAYILIAMQSHLGYHLGQINYHRRLLDL
ncbi:MAG: DUF1572 family protein [Cytophagales bacterium]|nr:DUF1572 family protein [Cytophagales bacterium]